MMELEEDEELLYLERARVGDAEAFGHLVARYTSPLHGYVARYIFDPEDVRDIVQEAFIDAFNGIAGYDPTRPFQPWLYSICKHRMFRFLRQLERRRSGSQRLVDEALVAMAEHDDAQQILEGQRRLAALEACLDQLEDGQRELIHNRYVDGQTVKTIAQHARRSVDSVGMRLSRLRAALRRCIEHRLALEAATR